MLDEKTLRRPEFSEGYRVPLEDGQEWHLPKSRIRWSPRFGIDGKISIGGGASFGPEFDDKMDVIYGIVEADGAERLRTEFELAARLLLANYDLTPQNVSDLIVWEPDNESNDERWLQIKRAIRGMDPKKHLPDTSERP